MWQYCNHLIEYVSRIWASLTWSNLVIVVWQQAKSIFTTDKDNSKKCAFFKNGQKWHKILDHEISIQGQKFWFFGFQLKWKNYPKSDFEYGLLITIQSTKFDCNSDWTIQQSNPAIPWA